MRETRLEELLGRNTHSSSENGSGTTVPELSGIPEVSGAVLRSNVITSHRFIIYLPRLRKWLLKNRSERRDIGLGQTLMRMSLFHWSDKHERKTGWRRAA